MTVGLVLGVLASLPLFAPRAAESPPTANRTLVVAVRAEPPSLSSKPFRTLGVTPDLSGRMFNAGLTIRNDDGQAVPYLAEAMPQFSTGTWQVLPDGTMETTYRLKPRLVWHDQWPLAAEDFVFSFAVYSDPALAASVSPPISLMEQVAAPDSTTVVIRWKRAFADADSLQAGNGGMSATAFPPLPKHLLSEAFLSQASDVFLSNAFWTQRYVGAGPYMLDRWEPGVFLEGVAFAGHSLGSPRINRIREVFIGDANVVVVNLLAGEVQMTAGDAIRYQQGVLLQQQWGDHGEVLNAPNLYRMVQFQRRPEYASTLAFRDVRVRQALHYGVDTDALSEALFHGSGFPAIGPIKPSTSFYPQLDAAVRHYPFDPRFSGQLITAAGFVASADGVWTNSDPALGRLSFELSALAAPDNTNEVQLLADTWRKLGFEVREVQWASALGVDTQFRNTFPGLSATSNPAGEIALADYRSDRVPTAARRWTGSNRGGWPGTPAYDRLVDVLETSLDRDERVRAAIEMNRILNEDVVVINLYWKPNAQAFARGVVGPRRTDPNGAADWNLHAWTYS